MFAGCVVQPDPGVKLFPGEIDLPRLPQARLVDCPSEPELVSQRPHQRLCQAISRASSPFEGRDAYRRVMVEEKRWTRFQTEELIEDGWFLPECGPFLLIREFSLPGERRQIVELVLFPNARDEATPCSAPSQGS